MSSPVAPIALESISSVMEEQSQPQPYSLKIWIRNGFGVALTAKYSLYPLFHAKASFKAFAFSRMPFHRKDGMVSEILLQFSEVYRKSQMVFYSSVRSFPVHLHEHLQNMLLTDSFLYLQL